MRCSGNPLLLQARHMTTVFNEYGHLAAYIATLPGFSGAISSFAFFFRFLSLLVLLRGFFHLIFIAPFLQVGVRCLVFFLEHCFRHVQERLGGFCHAVSR